MKQNFLTNIILTIVIFVAGFLTCLKTSQKVKIKYIAGKTITDTLEVLVPYEVEIPAKPVLPTRPDTMYVDSIVFITEVVDTTAIVEEFIVAKKYAFKVFDNEHGKLDVNQEIQYNTLQKFGYTFTPITKQITINKERVFEPFISGGYSTNNNAIVGCGIYINKIGVEYNYNIKLSNSIYDGVVVYDENYHTVKLNYRF